jgi:hypothetical protein
VLAPVAASIQVVEINGSAMKTQPAHDLGRQQRQHEKVVKIPLMGVLCL